MAELLNTAQAARHFGTNDAAVTAAIKLAGLEPVHVARTGKGVSKLYAEEGVRDALEQARIARETKEAAKVAPAPSDAGIDRVMGVLDRIEVDVADVYISAEAARADCAKLSDQNRALLLAFGKMQSEVFARLDAMTKVFGASQSHQVPPAPPAAPYVISGGIADFPKAKPVPSKKIIVGIVGLTSQQAQLIQKEFGMSFDLRFFESKEAKGTSYISMLGACDHVLAFTNGINHGLEPTIKGAGNTLIRLNGGVSTVKSKLIELFQAQATPKAMAA